MPKGTSGYFKPKGQTAKELNKVFDEDRSEPEDNAIDDGVGAAERAAEEARGITNRVRNIFEK